MKTQIAGSNGMVGSVVIRRSMVRKVLLACGILSSLLYIVANDVLAAMRYPGYNRISQPISELSATFAPSRPILVPLIVIYEVLLIAFGIGVWRSAHNKRALRVTSGLVIAFGAVGLASFPFAMTQLDLTNTMHNITMGIVTPLLMFLAVGFGAASLGRWFRLYSILTFVALVVSSGLIIMETARIAAGEPAPWFGLTERMLIGAWLLWVAVLAIVLLRPQLEQTGT